MKVMLLNFSHGHMTSGMSIHRRLSNNLGWSTTAFNDQYFGPIAYLLCCDIIVNL